MKPTPERLEAWQLAMSEPVASPNCCARHPELTAGCNQGRACPERGYWPRDSMQEMLDEPPYSFAQTVRYYACIVAIGAVCCFAVCAALVALLWPR